MPEQFTSLQFWNDVVNKDFEGTRKMRGQDHKSIGSLSDKPLFQNIRNRGRKLFASIQSLARPNLKDEATLTHRR